MHTYIHKQYGDLKNYVPEELWELSYAPRDPLYGVVLVEAWLSSQLAPK
jgi:hypothetical protein